ATIGTASLGAGSHTVTASYSGDTNFSSSSASLSGGQVVQKATTGTAVSSSLNPSNVGQSVIFTAAVTPGSACFDNGGTVQVVGAWNGSGLNEIGTYRVDTSITDPITGKHVLVFSLNVSGTGVWNPAAGDQAFVFGLEGDTVVVGDWNGTGKATVGVVRPGSDG